MLGVAAAVLALFLSLSPAACADAAKEALSLCAVLLLPSLFPFFVCANILVATGTAARAGKLCGKLMRPIFGVDGNGAAALVLGLLGGYPTGAAVTCALYQNGSLSRTDATRLLAYTNNAGPLFILGAVGVGLFSSAQIGVILLLAHVLAALSTGLIMRPRKSASLTTAPPPASQKKGDPVWDAVQSVLTLCGYVVFFAIVLAFFEHMGILALSERVLTALGIAPATAALLVRGVLELSTAISTCGGSDIAAVSAILSLGGVSVFLQTRAIVRRSGLSMRGYLLGKPLCAVLSAFYCKVLLHFFPVAVPTAAVAAHTLPRLHIYAIYLLLAIAMSAAVFGLFHVLSAKRHY